jgi:hypothetical protein
MPRQQPGREPGPSASSASNPVVSSMAFALPA